MPATGLKAGSDLTIQVDNLSRTFSPGSVITGRVIRNTHAVSPMATVEVRLCGRAKVKIGKTRSNGQSTYTTYYRGRFNFFDDSTACRLYTGPLHIAQGGPGEAWPFAIQIPLNPSPGALLSEHGDSRSSFLSLGSSSIASSPLPGSFVASGRSLSTSTKFECYVEYHLDASLLQQSSHGSSSTATLPLRIQPQPMPYPLASLDLKRHTRGGSVSTYRLVPGMEDAHLSFKQKTQKLFRSSKVPGLHFAVKVDSPGIIQLGHPSPVPLRVSIEADRRHSSEVIYDAPQTALVTSLELVLKANTHVVAPGSCGVAKYETDDSVKHRIILPIYAPAVARPSSSNKSMAMDSSAAGPDRLPAYEKQAASHPTVSSADEKGGLPAYSPKPAPSSRASRASEDGAGSPSSPGSSKAEKHVPREPPAAAGEPLVLPISWEQGGDGRALDVGAVLDLHIHRTGATALGRRISDARECPIHPSFITYCIRHSHSLKWKVGLAIAGESVKFDGELPVSVVGPSAGGSHDVGSPWEG